MRIDVLSIFPEYMAPLALSLPGKARESGLLDLHSHDLRQWTHDSHHTVDDTPYGGGAGMVMKPEPWGEALDAMLAEGPLPRLLVMTPSGIPFTQSDAARLSCEDRLIFACGRYEGIDARVMEWAREQMPVEEISIGDYVLNGGEVAAMVCIEAIVRLIPGFMGNPESLTEESHNGDDPLLEYPAYTKPASWRGYDVPEVLLSGDHGRIATWRNMQAARRTRARRPDLWTRPPRSLRLLDDPGFPPPMSGIRFEVLGSKHAQKDLAAWSSSISHIHQTPGFTTKTWPDSEPLSALEQEADIRRRQVRHEAGVEFSWAIIDDLTEEYLGAAYVFQLVDGSWEGRCWVRESHAMFDRLIRNHLASWWGMWPVKIRVRKR
ncbi:MAG: tRNA (guanosine(37)-N1)-methyltransferase TrmD [Propionibacteriaceae bacterium]